MSARFRRMVTAIALALLPAVAAAQTGEVDSLFARAESELSDGRAQLLDILAPRQFRRASDAVAEARSLQDRGREANLIRLKLKVGLDELDGARQVADRGRARLSEVLAARSAALGVGSDTINAQVWTRCENGLRELAADLERSPSSVRQQRISDVTGAYRAARRETLRSSILGEARRRVGEAESKNAARLVPDVLLRAQQALSRAEASLAQENLDSAKVHSQAAKRAADHALGMIARIQAIQKSALPWQEAMLPYDDLLQEIAARFDTTPDFSRGGVEAGRQLAALIAARQESLQTQALAHDAVVRSLEQSLAESQTILTSLQSRIAGLESRLQAAEGARSSALEQLQKGAETADRVNRARALFKSDEAEVLQTKDGQVVIRLRSLQFPPGATKLDKTHSKLLDKVAEAINLFPGAAARVEGHTDSEGGDDLNQRLSEARAKAVAGYLTGKLGVSSAQLPAVGFGESQPVAGNDTAEGRRRNRRIEIVLTLPK